MVPPFCGAFDDPDSLVREEGVESFTQRVQSAQALSDYFFDKLASGLNLSEVEGRALFFSKAKPYLDKLTEGAFKDMMFERLQLLSGMSGLVNTDKNFVMDVAPKLRAQDLNRLSSARVALALLLQNPRLAECVEQKEIEWDGLEFRGVELFRSVLEVILAKGAVNTAVLIEHYRNTPQEKSVKALALLDVFVPEDKIEDVFSDALSGLLKQASETSIARLQAKAQAQGLDKEELSLLLRMLSIK